MQLLLNAWCRLHPVVAVEPEQKEIASYGVGAVFAAGAVYAAIQAKKKRDAGAVIDLYNAIVDLPDPNDLTQDMVLQVRTSGGAADGATSLCRTRACCVRCSALCGIRSVALPWLCCAPSCSANTNALISWAPAQGTAGVAKPPRHDLLCPPPGGGGGACMHLLVQPPQDAVLGAHQSKTSSAMASFDVPSLPAPRSPGCRWAASTASTCTRTSWTA